MSTTAGKLKIAIASSGLGHIARGVESGANDLATALKRAGQDVTLFQGGGASHEDWRVVIPCFQRGQARSRFCVRMTTGLGGWRYGFGSTYNVEQTTFTLGLWRHIHRNYDILHVQDPWIAIFMERLRRMGLSRPDVIMADATEEEPDVLRKFANLQHLSPCYLADWEKHRPPGQYVTAIPYMVDTGVFCPGDRLAARTALDLPKDHLIVLSVAAVKKVHKRIDYLVSEFAQFARRYQGQATLVVAGAREPDTDEIVDAARELLGDRVRFYINYPRERIPQLYQAADIFAFASLYEMLGIAVLEALSSGLPIACNSTPTFQWIVGPAGRPSDISSPGALASQLEELSSPERREEYARHGRRYAQSTFSEEAVVAQTLAMFAEVNSRSGRRNQRSAP